MHYVMNVFIDSYINMAFIKVLLKLRIMFAFRLYKHKMIQYQFNPEFLFDA